MDYKNAGVDIEAGYQSVELMKKYVKETMRPEVLGGLGGFSGAFSLEKFIPSPPNNSFILLNNFLNLPQFRRRKTNVLCNTHLH